MEITSALWLSELGMEDPSFNYYPHQFTPLDYPIDDLDFESFMNCPAIQTSQTVLERPKKQQKTNSWNSCTSDPVTSQAATPSSHIISFEKSLKTSPATHQQHYGLKPKSEIESNNLFADNSPLDGKFALAYYGQGSKKIAAAGSGRTPSHAQDHVIAERKRREKLSQRFIALSSIVPGLKKMDKASVLGEAIKYLKHMQDRVKTLEEQAAKRPMESVVFVKKSQVYTDDDLSSSSDENFDGSCDQTLPEIEARVSDKDVLIRIHCENQKGCIQKILNQVEKLPLNVTNTSILPFGNSTLDVTIVAQVEGELLMTVKDVVKTLRQGLIN
ncbi:transcription factor bHLH18-like [Euphorbia lathyris]|uniref:transcription factor bHLH18-like n=1 Tax=Euphorbia lathyris TaxID=212925 RepID=UPI00331407D9